MPPTSNIRASLLAVVFHLTQQPGCQRWSAASPGHNPDNTFTSCGEFFWGLVIKLYWVLNLDPVQRSARPVSAWHVTRDPSWHVASGICVWPVVCGGEGGCTTATCYFWSSNNAQNIVHSPFFKSRQSRYIPDILLDGDTLIEIHNSMRNCFRINISRFVV